jgi:hypothetical protein
MASSFNSFIKSMSKAYEGTDDIEDYEGQLDEDEDEISDDEIDEDDKATEEDGIDMGDIDDADLEDDEPADASDSASVDSLLVLSALKSTLPADQFVSLVKDCKQAMELYGVINSEKLADDLINKAKQEAREFGTVETLASLKLAERNYDSAFESYARHTRYAQKYLNQILNEYGATAAAESASIIKNASRKARHIKGAGGQRVSLILEEYLK